MFRSTMIGLMRVFFTYAILILCDHFVDGENEEHMFGE